MFTLVPKVLEVTSEEVPSAARAAIQAGQDMVAFFGEDVVKRLGGMSKKASLISQVDVSVRRMPFRHNWR